MGFSTTMLPDIDPGSLYGAVRNREAILKNLQAEAFRSASQEQANNQVGHGGHDGRGNVTENGGNALNTATGNLTNTDTVSVTSFGSTVIQARMVDEPWLWLMG